MNQKIRIILGLSLLVFSAPAAMGSETKNDYSLFNPTPKSEMREFSTDRPDQTESAYTVPAGRIQVEMDLVNYTTDNDKRSNVFTQKMLPANINFKLGLTHNTDLQFLFCPFTNERKEDRGNGKTTHASGFGELVTRLKINMWGNDEGQTALAIMPYVKLPASANDLRNGKWEGGLIMPYAVALGENLDLGLMAQADFVYDEESNSTKTEYLTSATLGRSLTEKLGMYTEVATRFTQSTPLQAQFDFGFTYLIFEDTQLDIGSNIGLTPDAPDLTVFSGISWRM